MTRLSYRYPVRTLLALLLLLAGCDGHDAPAAAAGGLEKPRITVAAVPIITNAAYYIALKEKLFEAEGLTVETELVPSGLQALPELKNGGIDLVDANDASMLIGHDQGDLPINLIAEGTTLTPHFMSVLTLPGSPIHSIKDLAGHSVSVHVLNNIQAITLNAIATANGVDPAQIKYRQVPFPQMAATLQKGDLDAIHVTDPFLTDAETKLGAVEAIDGGQAPVTGLPMDGYFAVDGWATKYPKTAAAFERAMREARAIASSDRTKVIEVMPTYIKNVDLKASAQYVMPGFPEANSADRIQRLIDLMREQGQLKNRIDAKAIVFQPPA